MTDRDPRWDGDDGRPEEGGGLRPRLDGAVGRALHRLAGSGADAGAGTDAGPGDRSGGGVGGPGGDGILHLADDASSRERALLASVDTYLSRGRDLMHWWNRVFPDRAFRERFDLGRTFNEAADSFGFFDRAPVDGGSMEVMGNYQEMFYDRPKSPTSNRDAAIAWTRDQVREFVLHYFMRVSDFRAPDGYADTWRPPLSTLLSLLSWCPGEVEALRGFGFQQLWYKEKGGRVGRFPDHRAYSVVDLRELGERYEWIVVKVRIFDFEFSFAPFGADGPRLSLPLPESSYLVLTADLVSCEERPEPGLLGRYGIGYAFLRDPGGGVLQYGPGQFEAALELIRFEVAEDGSVRVPMVFVANRPERVLRLELDPVDTFLDAGLGMMDLATLGIASPWLRTASRVLHALPRPRLAVDPVLGYVALADAMSDGMAADYLCIDRTQLEKEFLVKHYMQHYQAIAGSLATWRLVPDWLDREALPRWVREGRRP